MSATFEQNAEFLAVAAREAREEARRLLARIEILIAGLAVKDPRRGTRLAPLGGGVPGVGRRQPGAARRRPTCPWWRGRRATAPAKWSPC